MKSRVDEAIKLVLKAVFFDQQREIRPKKDSNQLAFQIKGFKDYMKANQQIILFERVSTALRRNKDHILNVVLTEIP